MTQFQDGIANGIYFLAKDCNMSNLCVIKTHRNNKYSTINLTAEEDKTLSWKAKGIHTYLISRPDGWEVYLSELEKRSTDGIDGLRAGLDELRMAGYFDWHQKNEGGKFSKIQYDVYETPNKSVIKKVAASKKMVKKAAPRKENPEAVAQPDLPEAENPEAGFNENSKKYDITLEETKSPPHRDLPDSGKSDPTIYHLENNTNINHINLAPKNDAEKIAVVKKSFFGAEFVLLSTGEYEKLIERYGDSATKRFIEKLDNWKGVNPKKRKYESDYRAILNWVVSAVQDEIAKENLRNGQTQRNTGNGRNFGGNTNGDASKGRLFQPDEQGQYGGVSGKRSLRELLDKNSENAARVQ